MIKRPSLHQCTFPITNILGILPFSHPPPASKADNIPHTLSLLLGIIACNTDTERSSCLVHYLLSACISHPNWFLQPLFSSDPFSIPSAFSPLLMKQSSSHGAILALVSTVIGCQPHVMLPYTPQMSAVPLRLPLSFRLISLSMILSMFIHL